MQRQDLTLLNDGVQIRINGRMFVPYHDTYPAVVLCLVTDASTLLVSINLSVWLHYMTLLLLLVGFVYFLIFKLRWCDRWE